MCSSSSVGGSMAADSAVDSDTEREAVAMEREAVDALCVEVEGAVFAFFARTVSRAYQAKARQLVFNLGARGNGCLRQRLLRRELTAARFVRMSGDELARYCRSHACVSCLCALPSYNAHRLARMTLCLVPVRIVTGSCGCCVVRVSRCCRWGVPPLGLTVPLCCMFLFRTNVPHHATAITTPPPTLTPPPRTLAPTTPALS